MLSQNQIQQVRESLEIIEELYPLVAGGDPASEEGLEQVYHRIIHTLLSEEKLHFSTGFSALSYIGIKYQLDGKLMYELHAYRKSLESAPAKTPSFEKRAYRSMAELLCKLLKRDLPDFIQSIDIQPGNPGEKKSEKNTYVAAEKVLFTGKKQGDSWIGLSEERGGAAMAFDLDRARFFEKNLEELMEHGRPNTTLLLKESEIDNRGVWHPQMIVIEPDFIIDVTAVASCIQPDGHFPSIHLLKKFLPPKTTKYLLGGHMANYFLDRLIANPSLKYEELIKESFFVDPIGFCTLSNEEVQFLAVRAVHYYRNLVRLIKDNFLAEGKDLGEFSVEPSFYSPQNGLQGRLDLLYRDRENKKLEIFELKSGSTFRPNAYKINPSHYAQTMLYYLIVKDLYPSDTRLSAFIIYAKDRESLRYAPSAKAFQQQTIAVRNQLLIRELVMQRLDEIPSEEWEKRLGLDELTELKGFTGSDAREVTGKWKALDALEQSYFRHFYAFVSREYRNSKTQLFSQSDRRGGLSALWLDSRKSKEDRFAIFSGLKLTRDQGMEDNPLLTFSKKECPQQLANFRIGDVVVLYTDQNTQNRTPFLQVYRGTLIDIDRESLTVRLRSKWSDSDKPPSAASWILEPDVLESGFQHYFRSLAFFMHASPEKRQLWMGRIPPRKGKEKEFSPVAELTEEQNRVLQKIIDCRDYFLLWGPPGTGKTSRVIRQLVRHLVEQGRERVLLLAYTNRAVDEICDAIKSISPEFEKQCIRIGSRYGTHPEHQDLLLDRQISPLKSRREVFQLLNDKRVYTSTLSSFFGKTELLKLIEFDTVIIDEASQILEPNLSGLLSLFKRTVLIGDHCQLPAIVTQSPRDCQVNNPDLRALGLEDLSDSLFERLFRRAEKKGWVHAYDKLTHQGRMHTDICQFISRYFYGKNLGCIHPELPGSQRLYRDISDYYKLPESISGHPILTGDRVTFIDHPSEKMPLKTNQWEAETVVKLATAFFHQLSAVNKEPSDRLLGVICPYRAQIALIRSKLDKQLPQFSAFITVDTVERYQGGARDVVLLSLCTNHRSQIQTLVNANRNGLDRKLNVALTRAREQIVVLGNRKILSLNSTYRDLIQYAGTPLPTGLIHS